MKNDMNFTTTAGKLYSALSTARAVTTPTSTLVAFSGVLLLVKGDRLSVIGADGDTAIAASVPLDNSTDGEALVAPKPLAGFLSAVDQAAEITVQSDSVDVTVQVAGLAAPYTFRAIQARFPRPPAARAAPTEVSFNDIDRAVNAVRSAVDRDHGGVLVISDDKTLKLFATDHYQLHAATVAGAGFGEFTGVVPLQVWERIALLEITGVVADVRGKTLRFSGTDLLISTRLLSVAMPDMTNVLTSTPPMSAQVRVAELKHALKRLTAVTGSEPALLTIAEGQLSLAATNSEAGSGSEMLPVTTTATASIALDPQRLISALAAHTADIVSMSFGTEIDPLHVKSKTGRTEITTVVSPIRT